MGAAGPGAGVHVDLPYNLKKYFYGSSGNFYQYDNNQVSLIQNIPSGHGEGMDILDRYIYLATHDNISRYGDLGSNPQLSVNFLDDGVTNVDVKNTYRPSGGTLSVPITLDEKIRKTFVTHTDPIKGIKLNLSAINSGDITLIVHDGQDNLIGEISVDRKSVV